MGSDYTGKNAAERGYGQGRNISGIVKPTYSNAASSPKPENGETQEQAYIRTRMNPLLMKRLKQLKRNILGLRGGRPYITARLSRFPGEPSLMFEGGTNREGKHIDGRCEQTHVVPHLTRIANKISQYVLSSVERGEVDNDLIRDITRRGESLNSFMRKVNDMITACRWCWIGVDLPSFDHSPSVLEQKKNKLRPYWTLWSPTEVVDWAFDEVGGLVWLLAESSIEIGDDDPRSARGVRAVRYLYERDQVTAYVYGDGNNVPRHLIEDQQTIYTGYGLVPFVLAGELSDDPHLFDSLEGINKTIMDLESANRQNYFEGVFPQRYFPASMRRAWQDPKTTGAQSGGIGLAIGNHDAIFVDPEESPPGIVAPNALISFEPMRREIDTLKREMYETAGLLIRQESRAAQSGESKAFDHIEVEQGLRERSLMLEEAEKKAIAVTKAISPGTPEWEPVYPREFNVSNFIEEMKALVLAANTAMPDEMMRIVLKGMIDRVERAGIPITAEDKEAAMVALETYTNSIGIGNTEGLTDDF